MEKIVIFILMFCSVTLITFWVVNLSQKWLGEYEDYYTSRVEKLLEEMFIFQDVKKIFYLNIFVSVLCVLFSAIVLRDWVFVVVSGLGGFYLPKMCILLARKRRTELFSLQFVDSLFLLSNSLRSGLTLMQAVEVVETECSPPLSQEFGLVLREHKFGIPIEQALTNMTKRINNDDLKLMVVAVSIIHSMGGNLIEIFDSLALVIRERTKLEAKTKSLTAQGKMQGLIVGLLPTFIAAVMFLVEPGLMKAMFTTVYGNIALAVMLVLQITGYTILQKLTRIEI